jgi:hypothetical protein
MPNRVFIKLIEEKIEVFKKSFSNAKEIFYNPETERLIHPGEFGIYREKAVENFISSFIPNKLKIDSGFVINNNDEISHQCDLVIFDSGLTPNIHSSNNQRFYPIETTVGVGEVKSIVNSKEDLREALLKLSKVKVMRENIIDPFVHQQLGKGSKINYSPTDNPHDQIFTFLICEKFNFNIKDQFNTPEEAMSYFYPETDNRFRHNLILSIMDGLFIYVSDIGNIGYPVLGSNLKSGFVLPKEDLHFMEFILATMTILGFTTILSPDLKHYIYPYQK